MKGSPHSRHIHRMRPFALLLLLTAPAIGQNYVRPWVAPPPKTAPARQLRLPDVPPAPDPAPRPPYRARPVLLPVGYPFPLVLTPCTTFPGNPVFLIEGNKITMRKDPAR